MKNIHLLKTDKVSNLTLRLKTGEFLHSNEVFGNNKNVNVNYNIYITSDKEIKKGDWVIYNNDLQKSDGISFKSIDKKIILTTDIDLIKTGVQAIDNEFLEWFCSQNEKVDFVEVITIKDEKN